MTERRRSFKQPVEEVVAQLSLLPDVEWGMGATTGNLRMNAPFGPNRRINVREGHVQPGRAKYVMKRLLHDLARQPE